MRSLAPHASRFSVRAEPALEEAAPELPTPPIRLRFVLLAALLYAAWSLGYPRLSAAWKLHARATALADYGTCMAGPTGPSLLRDRKLEEVRRLVRRRLVASPAGEAPFARCAPLALTLTESSEAERAHRAPARSFAEYARSPDAPLSLESLGLSTGGLAELARAAWPFVRGYAALVKPSLSAKQAPHPVAPPTPALGRGLPVGRPLYRAARHESRVVLLAAGTGANSEALASEDGGSTWRSVPRERVSDLSGRCPAGPHGRAFLVSQNGDGTVVVSTEPGLVPRAAPLTNANEELIAFACDEKAAVAVLRSEAGGPALLRQCPFAAPCGALRSPEIAELGGGDAFPVDVARVHGTTIVALGMGDVVRVVSSRDGGATWTPFAVAFDAAEDGSAGFRPPSELLVVGRRVFLYAPPRRPGDTYALLYSDDHGASWHGR